VMQRKGITRFGKCKSTETVIINVKVEGSSRKCVDTHTHTHGPSIPVITQEL